jgi:hypothetical protein
VREQQRAEQQHDIEEAGEREEDACRGGGEGNDRPVCGEEEEDRDASGDGAWPE